ncbi:MAG: S41 family peptidase [Kordiimonas sp.]
MTQKKLLTIGLIASALFTTTAYSSNSDLKFCEATHATSGQVQFSMPRDVGPIVSEADIHQSLDTWIENVRNTHPDISYSVSETKLNEAIATLHDEVKGPMSQLEVFRLFSKLNSVFADAHNGIMYPDRLNRITKSLQEGDRLFPLSVYIAPDHKLYARGTDNIKAGTEILTINGTKASAIVEELLIRARGDSDALRRDLVSKRFAEHFWQILGTAPRFDIGTKGDDCIEVHTLDGAASLPEERKPGAPDFDSVFSYKILDGNIGYLHAGIFVPYEYDRWLEFTETAFTNFAAKGVTSLIIDIRSNGGGDDQMWMNGIVPYITTKTWDRMANYKLRITEDDLEEGPLGGVAISDYTGTTTPEKKEHLFTGDVYVVTGVATYSSAIMFATAMQDNGIATIAGTETGGKSCSTGNFRTLGTGKSELYAYAPLHIYNRKADKGCERGVIPDVPLKEDPFNSSAAIEQLVAHINS